LLIFFQKSAQLLIALLTIFRFHNIGTTFFCIFPHFIFQRVKIKIEKNTLVLLLPPLMLLMKKKEAYEKSNYFIFISSIISLIINLLQFTDFIILRQLSVIRFDSFSLLLFFHFFLFALLIVLRLIFRRKLENKVFYCITQWWFHYWIMKLFKWFFHVKLIVMVLIEELSNCLLWEGYRRMGSWRCDLGIYFCGESRNKKSPVCLLVTKCSSQM